jgi:hypothetical protein
VSERLREWLHGFVLPLVAGGDVRVRGPLGAPDLAELERLAIELERDERVQRVAEARQAVMAELIVELPASLPELDGEALRLAIAMQNLLFLAHPAAESAGVRRRRLRDLARWSAALVESLPRPGDAVQLAARHSMLHHLFDLGRDDVRVSFWAGRREFKGAEPPSRLLKWQAVRRVREERWRVSVVAEAAGDTEQRAVVNALLHASPLTDLLEPVRTDPSFNLRTLAPWLRDPRIARAVADRWLQLGFPHLGPSLTQSLLALYAERGAAAAARLATRFFCHLHLLRLLERPLADGPAIVREAQGGPLRDFFGLFAAAQRTGLGRPDDVARDEKLNKSIDAYAAACVNVCGSARVIELEALMARGTQEAAVA